MPYQIREHPRLGYIIVNSTHGLGDFISIRRLVETLGQSMSFENICLTDTNNRPMISFIGSDGITVYLKYGLGVIMPVDKVEKRTLEEAVFELNSVENE